MAVRKLFCKTLFYSLCSLILCFFYRKVEETQKGEFYCTVINCNYKHIFCFDLAAQAGRKRQRVYLSQDNLKEKVMNTLKMKRFRNQILIVKFGGNPKQY